MRKLLVSAILMLSFATAVQGAELSVRINNADNFLEEKAVEENGILYLPLHEILNTNEDRLRYDSDCDAVFVVRDEKEIAVIYTDKVLEKDGIEQYKAKKIDGKFYITPENYIKIFGGSVSWDKSKKTVDITENKYNFGLEEVMLFRPAERILKTDENGNVYFEICEEYSEIFPLKNGAGVYTKKVEEGRIPVVSPVKTYYGIEYSVSQAFKMRPTATVKLTQGDKTYIYTINFEECAD